MKIDNEGLTPISPKKKTGKVSRLSGQSSYAQASESLESKDVARLSEQARLMAKARSELSHACCPSIPITTIHSGLLTITCRLRRIRLR